MQTIHLPLGLLRSVEKPARYVGGERNQVVKEIPEDAKELLRFAFAFPDTYEIAMSNVALQIIYGLLNRDESIWCERVFAPWPDMEAGMREAALPLFTLESKTALAAMDVVGFSLQYELCFTNVLNMLDLASIPLLAKDRGREDTLVCAGGPVIYNPEPMADFFDFMVIGDAEEVLLEVVEEIKAYKKDGNMTRAALLLRLAAIPSVYVPSLYEVDYLATGQVKSITPIHDRVPASIKKAAVADLDHVFYPSMPLVPNTDIVHDRMFLEIFRGCPRGCRFCQAGIAYRPMREKSPDVLARQARDIAANTGYDELGMLSLSTSDYSCLPELTDALLESFDDKQISLSLPSLRVDNFSIDLLEKVSSTRKSGLTFAPEAGSQRLRDVINKGVTEEELMTSLSLAFRGGYDRIKLYFMLGLPTETDEDVLGIADLATKILALYENTPSKRRKRRLDLSISTALFIPKPKTPFQWVSQVDTSVLLHRRNLLKDHLPSRVKYNWHDPISSLWEAVLSRGDRRLGALIQRVWQMGQTFDSWHEHFNGDVWLEAAGAAGIDPAFYALRERDLDELLPWSHIDCGVSERFLMHEWEKAMKAELTTECRVSCQACGAQHYNAGVCPTGTGLLCELPKRSESIQVERNDNLMNKDPEGHTNNATIDLKIPAARDLTIEAGIEKDKLSIRLLFSREGSAAMLAHLDVMRTFERSLRRADIPLVFSEGYNPRPLIVFALPLSVGLEAKMDCVDIRVDQYRKPEDFLIRLNEALPGGFRALEARIIEGKMPSLMAEVQAAAYCFTFPGAAEYAIKLLEAETLIVNKFSKGKNKPLDIRPLIQSTELISQDSIRVLVCAGSNRNLRSDLLLDAMTMHLGLLESTAGNARIVREALYGIDQEDELIIIR